MLVINNTVFYPQQRRTSTNSCDQKSMDATHSNTRSTSMDINLDHANDIALDILDNCRTLGDAIHEPELFLEKDYSQDFICVICQCICNTPYDIGCKNGHIYCKSCLNQFFESSTHNKCPQCQDNVTRYGTRINHFALRLLLRLRILCPFNMDCCHDEKESDMYQCEWIGCYSDIIDHLKQKCKYGTFINNTTIQQMRDKYKKTKYNMNSSTSKNKLSATTKPSKDIWEISRAEITSYKVFWEQICENDDNLGNHVDRKTITAFFEEKLHLTSNELQKLWWIVCDSNSGDNNNKISENQFYAALHIARLHKNKYKPKCALNTLYSLPACLNSTNINKIRYNINISIGASDLKKVKESVEKSAAQKYDEKKKEINLNTRIGTMRELKIIAGVYKMKQVKHKNKQHNSSVHVNVNMNMNMNMNLAVNWNITKQDINSYKKWFIKADVNKDGFIDGNEARDFFGKSKLSGADLGKIWSMLNNQNKNGKLTEAQFYAFFHIVLNIKKGLGKLPDDFTLPLCLQQENILNVMNGRNNNNGLDDWSLSINNNVILYESTTNTNTSSPSNLLDSLSLIHCSTTASADHRARSDSIDSVHDWADFTFEF